MTVQYRVIAYNRTTDRVGSIIDVPKPLVPQVLAIARFGKALSCEPGESDLDGSQAREVANVLNFRSDPSRFHYHLETIVTAP